MEDHLGGQIGGQTDACGRSLGLSSASEQQGIVTGQSPSGRLRIALWVYGKEKVYGSIP
jgi:hypothetical protein